MNGVNRTEVPYGFYPIPWCKERYAINIDGQVWSFPKPLRLGYTKGKLIKTYSDRKGYIKVALRFSENKTRLCSVHRLLMQTFVPIEDDAEKQVNHKNGIKFDNRLENLEWVTARENVLHARANGFYPPVSEAQIERFKRLGKEKGAENGKAVSRAIVSVTKDGKLINKFCSTMDASRKLKIGYRAINNALRHGIPHVGGGLYWLYADSESAAEQIKALLKEFHENNS